MKKLLALFMVLILGSAVNAKAVKRDFSSVINESGVEKNAVAISIRDLNTGKPVYELNEKMLMHPASVQKLLTLPAAIDTLGEDYEFTTEVYKRSNNSFLIKLGADPYLTSDDLKKIANNISLETKKIYIDDSILE